MKKILISLVLLFVQIISAQNVDKTNTNSVELNPETSFEETKETIFTNDSSRLLTKSGINIVNYIATKFNIPDEALIEEISGIVVLLFTVEKDGSVSNVIVEKKLCDACDAEAIRVIKSTKYQVLTMNKEPIRVQYRIPIRVVLD